MTARIAFVSSALVLVAITVAGCGGGSGTPATSDAAARQSAAKGAIVGAINGDLRGAQLGGLVTVFGQGHVVAARKHVRPRHDFRFQLAPGSYRLGLGRLGNRWRGGCPHSPVVVRSGRVTHYDVRFGCDWK